MKFLQNYIKIFTKKNFHHYKKNIRHQIYFVTNYFDNRYCFNWKPR